jgi:hypothetical protein
MEDNIDQDGVCFVEIDNFESGFSIGYGRVRQDVFNSGDHITDGLDLDGFYRHNIVGFVHFINDLLYKNKRTLVLYRIFWK